MLTGRALSARAEAFVDAARSSVDSPGRGPRTAVVLGRLLGAGILVCAGTGLYSHLLQDSSRTFPWSADPAGLYRWTQGVHVAVGLGLGPLLLGKLWAVYPRLFSWPVVTGVRSALERVSVLVLVSTALLEVAIGVMNTAQLYTFPFSFRSTHFALAWVVVGSVALHVAVKWPVIAAHWRAAAGAGTETRPETGPARRDALTAIGSATAAVVLLTAGQSLRPLGPLALLSPRRPGVGPQGLPVNRTAEEAGVVEAASSSGWRLEVVGPRQVALALDDLRAMPQHTAVLPIACVEGWSQGATWTGVRLRDLLELVGAPPASDVRVTSLQVRGAFGTSTMGGAVTAADSTLLALALGGEPLHLDHGSPARVIAPGRPGVLQTKWVQRIEVLS